MCRRLSLAERLGAELHEEIRLGLLSSTVARELARLPRGTQHLIVTAVLGANDPRARDEVLADPLRYLGAAKAATSAGGDPRLGAGGNDVRRNLLGFAGVAARTWRSLERHAPAGLVGEEARILTPLVAEALDESRAITVRLERLLADSGTKA